MYKNSTVRWAEPGFRTKEFWSPKIRESEYTLGKGIPSQSTPGPKDFWSKGLLSQRTSEPKERLSESKDSWAKGLLNQRKSEILSQNTAEPKDSWTKGLLSQGLLSQRTSEPKDFWAKDSWAKDSWAKGLLKQRAPEPKVFPGTGLQSQKDFWAKGLLRLRILESKYSSNKELLTQKTSETKGLSLRTLISKGFWAEELLSERTLLVDLASGLLGIFAWEWKRIFWKFSADIHGGKWAVLHAKIRK